MVAKNNEKVNMKRRQQNQKFPSFQMFRFAAGGVGGAANKNDRKFLGFAPAASLLQKGYRCILAFLPVLRPPFFRRLRRPEALPSPRSVVVR